MAMRRVPRGRADLSRIAGTSRSHHWRWHNLKKNRVVLVLIGSITRGICGNSPDVLNLRRIKRDNSVGRDFERHVGEHDYAQSRSAIRTDVSDDVGFRQKIGQDPTRPNPAV